VVAPRHQEFFRVTSTDPKRMSSARHEFVQQLQALGDRGCAEYGDTGGIAARPVETCYQAIPTGSPLAVNTMGMVRVAAFATCGEGSPPVAAIRATCRRTRSAASSDNRSYWPCYDPSRNC
jgi:hypothetical protein